ncbi:hypothetical protein [Pseudoclavibacter helvolus]|uniref:hypothetical protein n=1 Tax=Pseudoclavibacter helvolus TaxID=255205 RepID=UPI003C7735FC
MPEPLEAALDALAPSGGDPLARVSAARDAARWLEEVALVQAVEQARAAGATWAQIGAALGTTGATATTRFGGTPEEREARAQQSRERAAERNRAASEAIGATPREDLPGMSVADAAEQLDLQLGTFRRRIQVARERNSDAFREAIALVQLSPKREVMRVVDLEAAARL